MEKILIIDDDSGAGDLYTSLLQCFGYEACFKTNATEVFQYLASNRPDLVLLDLMMPETSGLDMLRKIKSSTQTMGLAVVILSALDETNWRQRAAAAGAYDYWVKGSFDFSEFQEKVVECLANLHSLPREAPLLRNDPVSLSQE